MGDPAGIGAEVTAKAMAGLSPEERARYAVIGDSDTMERAVRAAGLELGLHSLIATSRERREQQDSGHQQEVRGKRFHMHTLPDV